jgi:glucosyl-3-phosphoglycerate synthase
MSVLNDEKPVNMEILVQSLGPLQSGSSVQPNVTRSAHTTVLLPILNIGAAPLLLEIAATLAVARTERSQPTLEPITPRIVALSVVQVPPDLPLTHGVEMARSYRALLDFLPEEVKVGDVGVRVDRVVRVAREVASAICTAAEDESADLVLFAWRDQPKHPEQHTYGSIIDATLRDLRCNVALCRPDGWHEAGRILLAVRGGPSAEHALDLAIPVARGLGAPIAVLHNVPPVVEGSAGTGEGQAAHLRAISGGSEVSVGTVLTLEEDPSVALTAEAHPGDLLVMGMPPLNPPGEGGPNLASILAHERGLPMLVVRAYGRGEASVQTRTGPLPEGADMPFERWFVENTYHADEFHDADEFVRLKRASGLSISVALLTSHDEGHIYSMLTGLKRVLQEMHPIADQIVVVDSGLSAETVETARRLGVEAHVAGDILPHAGSLYGRGESWWKSLAVMEGDLLVWLDPRAKRFHPSTVMSLAGPLLRVPSLQLVKAFTRPQTGGRKGGDEANIDAMDWGGSSLVRRDEGLLAGRIRVQALKPDDLRSLHPLQLAEMPLHTLVQVLYPTLAGVVAPFGRDVAGMRDALMSAPALTEEYNELALLLWTAARYGTRAVAQVELRHARPAAPPTPSLRSAIDVLNVLARKLPDPAARRDAEELTERLQAEVTASAPASTAAYEVRALAPVERPPMRES